MNFNNLMICTDFPEEAKTFFPYPIVDDLKSKEVQLMTEADENTSGPASIMLTDPDGNVILIDQHV